MGFTVRFTVYAVVCFVVCGATGMCFVVLLGLRRLRFTSFFDDTILDLCWIVPDLLLARLAFSSDRRLLQSCFFSHQCFTGAKQLCDLCNRTRLAWQRAGTVDCLSSRQRAGLTDSYNHSGNVG